MRPLQRFISATARSRTLRPTPLRPFHPFNPIAPTLSTPRVQATVRTYLLDKPPGPLPHKPAPHRDPNEPVYQLTFTCKACSHRSAHTISKQGYHKGTVLVKCPGCENRHLISDHLHIFSDTGVTIEDIMRQKGEQVQRGTVTPDGDVEFWSKDAEASVTPQQSTKKS